MGDSFMRERPNNRMSKILSANWLSIWTFRTNQEMNSVGASEFKTNWLLKNCCAFGPSRMIISPVKRHENNAEVQQG